MYWVKLPDGTCLNLDRAAIVNIFEDGVVNLWFPGDEDIVDLHGENAKAVARFMDNYALDMARRGDTNPSAIHKPDGD